MILVAALEPKEAGLYYQGVTATEQLEQTELESVYSPYDIRSCMGLHDSRGDATLPPIKCMRLRKPKEENGHDISKGFDPHKVKPLT